MVGGVKKETNKTYLVESSKTVMVEQMRDNIAIVNNIIVAENIVQAVHKNENFSDGVGNKRYMYLFLGLTKRLII